MNSTTLWTMALVTSGIVAGTCGGQTKEWDRRFGGSAYDLCYSIQQTADGGTIMLGVSNSGADGDKTEAARGLRDYWLVKVGANGTKEWDRRFGGASDEFGKSVQQTRDGGYILGGYSYSGVGGDKTQASRGQSDYWIVKTDAAGVKQWDRRFGGTAPEKLEHVLQTADGGYLLGGYSESGAGGDKTEASRGGWDYWIVKVDSTGTKEWDKRFGGDSWEALSGLAQAADGGFVLGGYSFSGAGGDKTEPAWGDADFWIVKVDANGTKQWDRRFGGANWDALYCLQPTSDGGYILAGDSESGADGDKTEASRGSSDYWVVKVNSTGAKQWDKRLGGTGWDSPDSIIQTADGGYLLGGSSDSGVGGDKTEPTRGDQDFWVVKVDAGGRKMWDRRFGGADTEWLYSVGQARDGDYLLGGHSASGTEGDNSQPSRGEFDFWLVKVNVQPPDAYESDGLMGMAKRLFNGRTQQHSIHEPGDIDWGKLIVGTHGVTGVTIETFGATGDTELWVYKGIGGPFVAYNDDIRPGNPFSRIRLGALSSGTYYVRVVAYGNHTAIPAYSLKARWTTRYARDAYESDNHLSSAKRIRNHQIQRRTIHLAGNKDWAKFTISRGGARRILIQTSGRSGDTELRLYSRAGRRLAFNDNGGPGLFSRITRSALPAGTYYIQVREKGNDGTIAAYTLYTKWIQR